MNISVTFKTLDARRLSKGINQLNINNNSTITTVSKDSGKMTISFVFSSNYEPNIGVVRIEGDVMVEADDKVLDEIMVEWEKSEKTNLPKDMAEKVHNSILSNCIVEASILARDLKLPAPIPMPHVSIKSNEEKQDVKEDTSYIR